jgi:hypothetical protein
MHFIFYFRLSSYLLIGSVFLALLVTEDYGLFSAIIFAAILAIGWQTDRGTWHIPVSPLFGTWQQWPFCWSACGCAFLETNGRCWAGEFLVFLQRRKFLRPNTITIISSFM